MAGLTLAPEDSDSLAKL